MIVDQIRDFPLSKAVPLALLLLTVGYIVGRPIYNIFFHPLRKFPGPVLWRANALPYQYWYMSGHSNKKFLALHQKYGDVVRVAPNQLSFQNADAWKDIMGHKKGVGTGENGKDPVFYSKNWGDIIGSYREDHSRMRRILSHGFSTQSMQAQQPLITKYVHLLIRRLHENSFGGTRPINVVAWYNYTTFDIIGDLAFGEPFGCLSSSTMHPWVEMVFQNVKQQAMLTSIRRLFPTIEPLLDAFAPKGMVGKIKSHRALVKANVAKRMAQPEPRADFMQSMIQTDHDGKEKMSLSEIEGNSDTLIVAGSETTATVLSAVTFYLCTHPDVLAKLADEVRSSFASEDEIDFSSVNGLKYLLAVLDETMRMFPPVGSSIPRKCQPNGDTINGQFIPGGTILDIWQWPLSHNPKYFALPDSFIPERWMGTDPLFANDRRDVVQPFSFGPRNCIGKNLAYVEMRTILARVIWNFDMRLAEESKNWEAETRLYSIWEKPPMHVYLTPRK
ncbi:Isotrichodermin C-15 hydroxylase [Neonectria ditissima]|uniref:Isotrichodermin C-15 hydroxylase n=1 Tax=Neonectria ditissima TaxID=78410 RepID=A0A0N8H869_9HYPO|nr:Isotrichodermin C-15 hydroxylase [Neonectria ditissima]